ncbi:cation-translocating P-type ATPase [Luteimicrobium subarcticum]|uniref:Ca2+-transporting ATPase n=1 Tax=Luteimicrobium subarcticum TaxID=620910 RepID=A0A2M8WTF8_9MICO|nr:cation-translocating P-type ATPase [Luteimicrobium subarcticum]PJI94164.1 Ca2+-transporting ATPase [Luteimicrobium subarcticum]
MSTGTAATTAPPDDQVAWHALDAPAVVERLGTQLDQGLDDTEVTARRARVGANEIVAAPAPSAWSVALTQLRDPMNLMLVGVAIVSFVIGQVPVGILVAALVLINVVMGTQQELKARASVDALAHLQTPQARVVRAGTLRQVPATDLVPGDVVQLEAGDLVPADARIVRSATLETQEAALTGESAPIPKDSHALPSADTALGDRTDMVFQNTSVTRGTATVVVTETGMRTQMGRIASMLDAVKPTRSPLQRELDKLTGVLGIIAWSAVLVIVVVGLLRGEDTEAILLLGISMAVSAIPTGLPSFVQAILAYGARQLADHKAVVKNLSDVETLGATSAINSDKTGTLTLNQMMVRSLYLGGRWYTVDGEGYAKTGAIRQAAGTQAPDFTPLAYGLCLDSDATVSDTGVVVGDPTEAALVVLAAKVGVDAEQTRRAYPRVAEVPFDSDYKFMATFHHAPVGGRQAFVGLVKGGPDVVLDRCSHATVDGRPVPLADARADIDAANLELSHQGLRVLAFAIRELDGREDEVVTDPMAAVTDLTFVGMVGIIDPLRPEAVDAVRIAHEAGIEVRMITGDHAVTAAAIGAELGLGAGAISGVELQAMSDEELSAALPDLHVFGRVTPQDKLRLARLMQEGGDIVAMTGDAVNDAAALKQADIGVAMGSGSEVTKQAGKMILTDDNFGTLVRAVRLGRAIYDKIVSYVRFQMAQLLSLVLLFLVASAFDLNGGVAMTPLMVLALNFFVAIFPVVAIILDPADPTIMSRPPRDPRLGVANARAVRQWLLYGAVTAAVMLVPLAFGPGDLSQDHATVRMTMTFVVTALATVVSGFFMRRDPASGFDRPVLPALRILAIPVLLVVAAVELPFLQVALMTTSLSGTQWLACLGLAAVVGVVVEVDKLIRRNRGTHPTVSLDVAAATAPQRARETSGVA